MNQPTTVIYDRRTLPESSNDDEAADRLPSATTKSHEVVPGSLRLGAIVSAPTAEKVAFDLKLLDGRTLRGRLALRVLTEGSMVKVYTHAILRGVDRAAD